MSIFSALQSGQPLIADLAATTFGIQLYANIKAMVEQAKAHLIHSIQNAGAIGI